MGIEDIINDTLERQYPTLQSDLIEVFENLGTSTSLSGLGGRVYKHREYIAQALREKAKNDEVKGHNE